MLEFKPFNKIKSGGSLSFGVLNPVECNDFAHLIGERVLVDGSMYMVKGVESFCHTAPWRKDEKIGIVVEDMN